MLTMSRKVHSLPYDIEWSYNVDVLKILYGITFGPHI